MSIQNTISLRTLTKKLIIDSGHRVNKISVVSLFRNNEDYIKVWTNYFTSIEKIYDCNFEYIFIENDSIDNTNSLLINFLEGRSGKIINPNNFGDYNNLPRCKKLEMMRNLSRKSIIESSSDWTLLIDSDVYFPLNILEKMFSNNPTMNNIGMLCAYGIEGIPSKEAAKSGFGAWGTDFHYYDTYTFIGENDSFFYPNCIFNKCLKCKDKHPITEKINPAGLLKVKSAFGGLAIIKSSVFSNTKIGWHAVQIGGTDKFMCEHIGLCVSMNTETGLEIAIDCDAPVYWDVTTFGK